jgi:hypothetical protein
MNAWFSHLKKNGIFIEFKNVKLFYTRIE